MIDTLLDWISLLVRWTHVIAGIAWIGSSFYFIALDAGLQPNPRLDHRVKGEAWQVHGGGFYQIQKFTVAPEFMPEHLTWFKWEAYGTWFFGFALLVLAYYLNPTVYLIDTSVMNIDPADAVPAAAASLVIGWFVYDLLCRSWFGRETARLAISGFVLLCAATYGYTHVFSGRGAFIQVGALVGTIMACQRPGHHHSRPAQNSRGATERSGTQPGLGPDRQAAVDPQQLPDLARRVHHAEQPLRVHLRLPTLQLADPGLHLHRQLPGAALVQHAACGWAHRREAGLASLARRRRPGAMRDRPGYSRPARGLGRRCRRAPRHLRRRQANRRSALPRLPRRQTKIPRIRRGTKRRHVRHPRADQAPVAPDHGPGSQDHTMPLGNITEITDAERSTLGTWIVSGSKLN